MTPQLSRVTLAAALMLTVAAAGAETIEDVEKNIIKAAQGVKSFTADIAVASELSMGMMSVKSSGSGTAEFIRHGDKMLSRTEISIKSTMKTGEKEETMEQSILTVLDGEYMYSLKEEAGQKTAVKTKPDTAATNMGTKEMFAQMRDGATLKLLPEEKVGEAEAYVIEATPKQPHPMAGKTTICFGKKTGILIKMVMLTADGQPMQTITLSNVKMGVDIKPDRFVFKAPEGVLVQDMTKMP